jgi:hypothetical protein
METSETYKKKMMARLEKCYVEIYLLDLIAVNAESDAQVRFVQELDVLHAKKREAAKKIQELEDASGEALEKAKRSADEIWDDLAIGIAHANIVFK